jgi:predicted ATPase
VERDDDVERSAVRHAGGRPAVVRSTGERVDPRIAMVATGEPRILTPDQRPRVFISSTLQELADERAAAREAIEALRLIPVMFELGARPHPARALYRAYLEQSHVFVGIYFARYGWVAPGEDVSGLEDEYRLSRALPRLVYLKNPAPGREPRLGELLARIRDEDTVAYKAFASTEELRALLRDDLAVLMAEHFLDATAPVQGPAPSAPGNRWRTTPVPHPLSTMLGRDHELATVAGLLDSGARLVTVVGPGGIGKTRVALEAARRLTETGDAPVSFVALEAVPNDGSVLAEVAASIGLGLDGGRPAVDALTAAFADRPFRLVVDNAEHVTAAAPDIAELLARCPHVAVLATSRAPLGVRGERLVPVGPLECPADDTAAAMATSAAVQLFVDRATAVRPDFSLDDPADGAAVIELCRRLDGIPLAVELAAARSALLAPAALLDRVGSALDLGAGSSDLPARQRTVRDTLAWSQRLLSPSQSSLLARLSVHLAPWTLADAEAVADPESGDVLDDVAGLVGNSLVVPAPPGPGHPRFRMYETVRAYAAELLDDTTRDAVETAYVERLSGQALELSQLIRSDDHERWMAEFRLAWPDLRRAWELALRRGDGDHTAKAAWSLLPLWLDGSVLKAYDLVDGSLRLGDAARPRHHPELVFLCAQAVFNIGDYGLAAALLDRLGADVPEPEDRDILGAERILRGFMAMSAGDLDTCQRELHGSVELLGSRDGGRASWLEAFAHTAVGAVMALQGDETGALEELRTARTLAHERGNISAEMQSLVFEADVHLAVGRLAEARELLEPACDLVARRPFFEGNGYCIEAVAACADAAGEPVEAARLLGLASALRDMLGARIWPVLEPTSRRTHDAVRAGLDAATFDAAFAEGQLLDPGTSGSLCRQVLGTTRGG